MRPPYLILVTVHHHMPVCSWTRTTGQLNLALTRHQHVISKAKKEAKQILRKNNTTRHHKIKQS